MPIHFTPEGIFADTEQERLEFYDRLCAGDPVAHAYIDIWRLSQKIESEKENDNERD